MIDPDRPLFHPRQDRYAEVLTLLGRLLNACRATFRDRPDCPCELCRDLRGMLWTLKVGRDLAEASAPPAALRQARLALGRGRLPPPPAGGGPAADEPTILPAERELR